MVGELPALDGLFGGLLVVVEGLVGVPFLIRVFHELSLESSIGSDAGSLLYNYVITLTETNSKPVDNVTHNQTCTSTHSRLTVDQDILTILKELPPDQLVARFEKLCHVIIFTVVCLEYHLLDA